MGVCMFFIWGATGGGREMCLRFMLTQNSFGLSRSNSSVAHCFSCVVFAYPSWQPGAPAGTRTNHTPAVMAQKQSCALEMGVRKGKRALWGLVVLARGGRRRLTVPSHCLATCPQQSYCSCNSRVLVTNDTLSYRLMMTGIG